MPKPTPTVRSLARQLGLSPTTVSDALRGRGRVNAETTARVRAAAHAADYRPNPITATVLSDIRRKRGSTYRGTIATIDLQEAENWPHGPFPQAIVAGARARAAEMGFSVEDFIVGPSFISMSRLNSILHSRGIHGIVILPSWYEPDLTGLDWSRYSGIYTDYVINNIPLHTVCPDHYGSMMALLRLLEARGYRRPGLVMQQRRDARIQHRSTAAFTAFQGTGAVTEKIPVLSTPLIAEFADDFAPWFRKHKPDVVLSHISETPQWIERLTGKPPGGENHGFVLLNAMAMTLPCATIDLLPATIGTRSTELIVGQLLSNEVGPPRAPSCTTIKARWVEGASVRSAAPGAPAVATTLM